MMAAGRKASRTAMTKLRFRGSVNIPFAMSQELGEIDRDDGENGAELDQHLEGLALRFEAEEMTEQQQMPVEDTGRIR